MGAATIGLIGVTAYQSMQSAAASKASGDYQQAIAGVNQKYANDRADDAIARGDTAAGAVHKKTKQLIGSQRAALGSSGTDVNSGSAVDLTSDSNRLGALDALTIKSNAAREAFGYRMEGINFWSQGRFAAIEGNNRARATLLTGGMQALSYYRSR